MRRVRVRMLVLFTLCVVLSELCAVAGADGRLRRRSLHQPFFPIEWSPPPPAASGGGGGSILPPPPAAATAAAANDEDGTGRFPPNTVSTVAIAVSAGLVALAVGAYSCFLFRRRRSDGEGGGRTGTGTGTATRSGKYVAAGAARATSDGDSSSRRHRSPPPSSAASDAIYLEPLTLEAELHQQSPDLRPLPPLTMAVELHRPSPDLRPLPPLKRPGHLPPPPLAATTSMTTTGASSDEDEEGTYYTAPKTAKSSFSRSTSQRSTVDAAAPPPPQPPQANSQRPPRPPPPPPPLPRRQLRRPLPSESPPPSPLATLALTNSPDPSVQDRAAEHPDGNGGRAPQPQPLPPSLKPLHWDKLRAISGRTTVWDQLKKSDTFRVDEEAMESLFLNSSAAGNSKQEARERATGKPESRLLDPKRLQNVAILLKALNVTADEVVGVLMERDPEDLGAEFFETVAKMAPTKEEELRLRDYSGDLARIDPAERFLKAVLNVPFAFKRVDALLYRANFDTEVKYLTKSFETLEAACADVRSSKLFLKLLDAVLKTGNRMNDGTNRGEARAFKLDTLLKLADVKSTDGKTSLLHFVVQEIIRSEGSGTDQPAGSPGSAGKEQFKKDGLKVLAGLSSELTNVKKAATLDMDALSSGVSKLEADLGKVRLVLQLKETCSDHGASEQFFETMSSFMERAQAGIETVKAAERSALQRVRETTEYFHGDATREEAHPLRIFVVVRDFLLTLDRVCRDVGRTPERVVMGSGKSFRVPASSSLPPAAQRYEARREVSSSDEDSSSS